MSPRTAIFPKKPHALYKQHGYSPAILCDNFLFVSGMVGAREDGTPEPHLNAQIQLAFDSLQGVLEAAGCSFDDVVDVTFYLVNPEASMDMLLEGIQKAFSQNPPPSVTAVGVTWLAGFQFEIKVIARVPQNRCDPGQPYELNIHN
ncbi:MAG: RidA family protein [Candidatus Methylacidiphilales bacterium]|nr:RidA family protein [Candidatus Methylacidiphilales bacterium]